jgi:hypothetical protein
MTQHPCLEVNIAINQLNDVLCMWERNTGHETVLIVQSGDYVHRSLDGIPVPDDIPTETLLNLVS